MKMTKKIIERTYDIIHKYNGWTYKYLRMD